MKAHILVLLLMLAALALLSSVARADSGGATINALPDSYQLEGHVEVSHECASEFCVWFGEATQYPANIECPAIYDGSHGVWVGSSIEHGSGTNSGSFAFIPEANTVHLCLYVDAEGENLVGQSHPFNTATGREVLPQPPPAPAKQPTNTTLKVKVYDGCKAHIYAYVNATEGAWSMRWQTPGSARPRFLSVSAKQPWTWAIEGPPSQYRFVVRYVGSTQFQSSRPATVVFRLRHCKR